MDHAPKFIHIAVGILITVLLVAASFVIVKLGKDLFNSGTEQLSDTTKDMSGGKYETYAGTTQTGASTRRIINETFPDENVEVLVCTKDGANLIYNGINFGQSTAKLQSVETGLPTSDATGKLFETNDSSKKAVISGAGVTLGKSGYNGTVEVTTMGYVSDIATFTCSVQKDINGDIRRITLIQK